MTAPTQPFWYKFVSPISTSFTKVKSLNYINDVDDLRDATYEDVKVILAPLGYSAPQLILNAKKSNESDEQAVELNNPRELIQSVKHRFVDDFELVISVPNDGEPPAKRLKTEAIDIEIAEAQSLYDDIIKAIPQNVNEYSNPQKILSLPFPYPGTIKPCERFIFNNGKFQFMGREKFAEVNAEVSMLNNDNFRSLFIYGTTGYGKSHILAALACHLFQQGKRVVYLPDCHAIISNFDSYIKQALYLAFGDQIDLLNIIRDSDIQEFCQDIKSKHSLYFIIDQINALDYDSSNPDPVSNQSKIEARKNLENLVFEHYVIKSTSANSMSCRVEEIQTSDVKIRLYCGFSKNEMKEWWKHYQADLPKMDDDDKRSVEDITGCVPLILNALKKFKDHSFDEEVKYRFMNEPELINIIQRVRNFSKNIQRGSILYKKHIEFMEKCILRQYVHGYQQSYYDHRYFFVEEGYGNYICGLARETIAAIIFEHNNRFFLEPKWINAIQDFGDNLSVLGFLVERICLAKIAHDGLYMDGRLVKPTKTINFSEKYPDYSLKRQVTFYVPSTFNLKAINGLLIRTYTTIEEKEVTTTGKKRRQIKKKKTKCAELIAIQITLAKSHSDSVMKFSDDIGEFSKKLEESFDQVDYTFLWINRDSNACSRVHSTKSRLLQSGKLMQTKFKEHIIPIADICNEVNDALENVTHGTDRDTSE